MTLRVKNTVVTQCYISEALEHQFVWLQIRRCVTKLPYLTKDFMIVLRDKFILSDSALTNVFGHWTSYDD